MRDKEVDQLAAILKSAGLAASVYDATNMAKSISEGVQTRQRDVSKRIGDNMGTGKRDEQLQNLFEPIKEAVVEAPKEVFVNQDSVGLDVGESTISQLVEPEAEISIFKEELPQMEVAQREMVIEAVQSAPEPKAEKMPDWVANQIAPQKRELIRGKTIYELDVDNSRPRPGLTDEEKRSTDLTKWFNFGK
ncbi:MAG: hypothetical protein ABIG95_05465 [Candidatus Woesearchaeota archaeon]